MRLASFIHAGRQGFGVVEGEEVRDLTGLRGHATLASVLTASACADFIGETRGPRLPLGELCLLPPISGSRAVFCVGVNYADRNDEYKDAAPPPTYPSLFLRMPESFTGHDQPLQRPRVSQQLDYEGEIAIIIGKGGRHIPTADALAHIAGLTLANEGAFVIGFGTPSST